jgi:hypothetical protein
MGRNDVGHRGIPRRPALFFRPNAWFAHIGLRAAGSANKISPSSDGFAPLAHADR